MKTMTFNLPLPPSFPPSIAPPSLHRSRLISLSKWFLTPSISLQPFRPRLGLVAGAKHCDRWNESPEKSHLLIKRSEAFSQSKKNFFFFPLSFLGADRRKKKGKKWAVIWRPFGVFLYPQLINAVLFVAGELRQYILHTFTDLLLYECHFFDYSLN